MGLQSLTRDTMIGQMLGHYRVEEEIGAGGMGVVYRAHDEHLDRQVAIKVLHPGLLADEHARKRFRKEALALSKLNHPNIATIHDFDSMQGLDFLVMEYIPGETLRRRLAQHAIAEREVLAIGMQVAEALSAAHNHEIVHGDLKPENLLLTADQRVKILDFGLAKMRPPVTAEGRTESLSEILAAGGTPPYMAPEQLLDGVVDLRTDIWAAGCVLHEMATGKRAFAGSGPALIEAIVHKQSDLNGVAKFHTSPQLRAVINKCLDKDPENRYQSAKDLAVDLRRIGTHASTPSTSWGVLPRHRVTREAVAKAAVAAIAIAMFGLVFAFYIHNHPKHRFKASSSIVIADFVNSTDDPVFDYALRQGVTVQLEQSPFLRVVSQAKVRKTLLLMGRSSDQQLTGAVAAEVCERAGGKGLLTGSIVALGHQYVIGLNVEECGTGRYLANAQVQADKKEEVLKALGSATSSLRTQLGESLASLRKFDTPIEEATTPSLEALKLYSLGRKQFNEKGNLAALPFFQKAIELDPNFAMAYYSLAAAEANLFRVNESRAAAEKAFALQSRVSEFEKLRISSLYYDLIGDTDRAIESYQLWAQTYPSDDVPLDNLSTIYAQDGRFGEAYAEIGKALTLKPDEWILYLNLSYILLALEEPETAEAKLADALRNKVGSASIFSSPLYELAFHRGDRDAMQRLLNDASNNESESKLLSAQSDTESYHGSMEHARTYSKEAINVAVRAGSVEEAALWQVNAALREAEFGFPDLARSGVRSSLSASQSWTIRALAALTFARIGDIARANAIVEDLQRTDPSNTQLKNYWLPCIEASIELDQSRPRRAIDILQRTKRYEFGRPDPLRVGTMYPAYLRGEAYLKMHEPNAAALEFQKLLDHPGIVLNYPLSSLARLQFARAQRMSGDATAAEKNYERFLTIWETADPELVLLRDAKSEYDKLRENH